MTQDTHGAVQHDGTQNSMLQLPHPVLLSVSNGHVFATEIVCHLYV